MNVQNVISNKELNNLFVKNNFYKNTDGSVSKYLSLKDRFLIKMKTGQNSTTVNDIFERPFSKESQEPFKGFLNLVGNKEFISKYFSGLFLMFNILSKHSMDYNDANKIIAENKGYSELFQNIVKTPPKKASVFDAIRRYKGVDCGKINSTLRGTNNRKEHLINKEIKQISKYLNTQVIKEPVKLYRSEGMEVLNNVKLKNGKTLNLAEILDNTVPRSDEIEKLNKNLANLKPQVTQKAFMSTSVSDRICQDFGHSSFYWELTTAPNTKAAFIEPLGINSSLWDEKEVLLQKGSNIKIQKIEYDENLCKWRIKGEVSN